MINKNGLRKSNPSLLAPALVMALYQACAVQLRRRARVRYRTSMVFMTRGEKREEMDRERAGGKTLSDKKNERSATPTVKAEKKKKT